MDALSDRDFAVEFLAAAALFAVHMSRLAEEMVIWCSDTFSFISLSDAFTTGSSIMPQKRNPDAAELVRAKPGRDHRRPERPAHRPERSAACLWQGHAGRQGRRFRRRRFTRHCHRRDPGMLADMTANPAAMRAALATGFPTATDLADYLVRELGLPFHRSAPCQRNHCRHGDRTRMRP